MKLLTQLYLMIFAKYIGRDVFRNRYYEIVNKKANTVKRFVMFNGLNEPSKVPPEWESWLRCATQKPITENYNSNTKRVHLPNLTGTIYAYNYTQYKNTKKYRSRSYWQG